MYYKDLSNKDQQMLQNAVDISQMSGCRQKHGAVITRGGRVLAVGVNVDRNFCLNVSNPASESSVHAEIQAIKACGDARGATIYIARTNRAGAVRLSKPCSSCATAISEAGIKKIVYTITE